VGICHDLVPFSFRGALELCDSLRAKMLDCLEITGENLECASDDVGMILSVSF
jgi:hypothetical protein